MYTFHVTFADQPDVLKVAGARERLAGLPGLDLIPPQWLHLTTQSVGFTDEVSDADVTAIAAAARHLAAIQPPRVTIGPARVASEGIAMPVTPAGSLDPLRDGLRAAIAEVWSPAAVPEAQEWTPHVSIAYSNVTGPAGTYLAALDEEDTTAAMDVRAVQLIILGRDSHLYEWTTCAEAQLRGGRGDAAGLRGAG